MNQTNNPWIVRRRPNPQARLTLFCFPHSGAGAATFNQWSDGLSDVEVCAIQYPGRENRLAEPLLTSLADLLQALADAILPELNRPFVFFGHSLGSMIAFELARYLHENHDLLPRHLFVSGHSAPQLPNLNPPLHHLPDDEFVAELGNYNGTPAGILENAELLELLLPILRADFALYETYDYQASAPLECPISAYGGLQDDKTSREGIEAWAEQTNGSFQWRMFPGDHFYIKSAQTRLLQTLQQELRPHILASTSVERVVA